MKWCRVLVGCMRHRNGKIHNNFLPQLKFRNCINLVIWFYKWWYWNVHCLMLQAPRVDDPKAIWNKLRDFVEQFKRDSPGPPKSWTVQHQYTIHCTVYKCSCMWFILWHFHWVVLDEFLGYNFMVRLFYLYNLV